MIEEIKLSNIIEFIKKMPQDDRIAINSELCNFEKSDSMILLEHNKALVEALEKIYDVESLCERDSLLRALAEINQIAHGALTTYKGEKT